MYSSHNTGWTCNESSNNNEKNLDNLTKVSQSSGWLHSSKIINNKADPNNKSLFHHIHRNYTCSCSKLYQVSSLNFNSVRIYANRSICLKVYWLVFKLLGKRILCLRIDMASFMIRLIRILHKNCWQLRCILGNWRIFHQWNRIIR